MDLTRLLLQCTMFYIIVLSPGMAQAEDTPMINIIIKSEIPPLGVPGPMDVNLTIALLNPLDGLGLNVTVVTTGEMAILYPLYLTLVGSKDNHELAMSGRSTDEDLGNLTDTDPYVLLLRAKSDIEANYICGGKILVVEGYMPDLEYVDRDTLPLKTVEDLQLRYIVDDRGLFASDDPRPHKIENSSLYVLPVTALEISDQPRVYMDDRRAKVVQRLDAVQWLGQMMEAFNQTQSDDLPLVVVFHNYISGDGEYLDAYKQFINFTVSRNATFMTSKGLVDGFGRK